MNETLTPRTDAKETDISGNGLTVLTKYVRADFARELERELAAVTEQRDRLAEAAKKGLESIERGKLDGCIESKPRLDLCFNDLREALQSLNPKNETR